MGDIFTIDEVTQKLLDTLERLELYDSHPLHEILRAAASNFGTPDKVLMSPEALKAFKKLI